MPISDVQTFDTELVSHVIADLKRGKAADIDGLSVEHLLFCHPAMCVVLTNIFYARQLYRQVLLRARISYGNSVRLSVRLWCHDPVPKQAQVR